MSRLLSLVFAFAAFSFFADIADAASRLGGGRNAGMQRQATPQKAPGAVGQQAVPQKAPQAAPAAPPQPQPSGWRRWLGPLAGLAIGAGIASLFFNNGMGGALMGMLLVVAIVMGAFMLFRMLRGNRTQSPLQYAGVGTPRSEPSVQPMPPAMGGGAAPHSVAAATQWPADFNADEFVRHAKMNFVKMQD